MLVGNPNDSSDVVSFVSSVKKGKRKTIGMNKKEKELLNQAVTLFDKEECKSVHRRLQEEAKAMLAADDDGLVSLDRQPKTRADERLERLTGC